MAKSRKDSKGRKLRDGESQRSDGRYSFRYTDRAGKRRGIYAHDLPELREKEKRISKDLEDSVTADVSLKKLTVNALFERYMELSTVSDSTRVNYTSAWNTHVKDGIGGIKAMRLLPSDIKALYTKLSKDGYACSTIKIVQNLLFPVLEMAVNDGIIRKNPAKGALGDYGRPPKELNALTLRQQEELLSFVKPHGVFNVYHPMLTVMLGTGLRCGELAGLTWNDVDMEKREVSVNHQLIYKNFGDGLKLHASTPKTASGIRAVPMTEKVFRAFEEQKTLNSLLNKDGKGFSVDGYSDFIFMTKNGRPLLMSSVNKILSNIVKDMNRQEKNGGEPFPHISAHVMRHTYCTNMAERGMDIKVLQFLMGHANINVTMDVYNHIADRSRIENEIAKIEKYAADF